MKKKLEYYKIKFIGNPCQLVLAINLKEYFKYFENKKSNKKNEGVKKVSSSMKFENFASRINLLNDIKKLREEEKEKQEQYRFLVKRVHMEKNIIQKSKFAKINDKRCYFSNGIVSFQFSPHSLKNLAKYKDEEGQKVEKYILDEKRELLRMENHALLQNERLRMLRNILSLNFTVCKIW